MSESLRKQLADLVASNRVVLFMKGTSSAWRKRERVANLSRAHSSSVQSRSGSYYWSPR